MIFITYYIFLMFIVATSSHEFEQSMSDTLDGNQVNLPLFCPSSDEEYSKFDVFRNNIIGNVIQIINSDQFQLCSDYFEFLTEEVIVPELVVNFESIKEDWAKSEFENFDKLLRFLGTLREHIADVQNVDFKQYFGKIPDQDGNLVELVNPFPEWLDCLILKKPEYISRKKASDGFFIDYSHFGEIRVERRHNKYNSQLFKYFKQLFQNQSLCKKDIARFNFEWSHSSIYMQGQSDIGDWIIASVLRLYGNRLTLTSKLTFTRSDQLALSFYDFDPFYIVFDSFFQFE